MADKLIKVDKNGTKYYADVVCRRCGGAGGADDEWFGSAGNPHRQPVVEIRFQPVDVALRNRKQLGEIAQSDPLHGGKASAAPFRHGHENGDDEGCEISVEFFATSFLFAEYMVY